ncbi:MAG: ISNCY family transposase [Nitrososphaerales archaeon]
MNWTLSFDRLRSILVATVTHLPDYRTGPQRVYEIADAALGAFAVFFTQSPSFLAYQRDMQRRKGHNNAQSLFGIDQVPSDPQIRNLLDPIAPEYLAGPFWRVFEHLQHGGYLEAYHGWFGPWLVTFDGTQYFHSTAIHCPQCTVRMLNDRPHYSHALVAPLIVAPGQHQVIALEPALIMPQDGSAKQDCELRASERWLLRNASRFPAGSVTVLGDDLYAHQPFCELLTHYAWHFIFTCKPESHLALYQEVELLSKVDGVQELTERHHHGSRREEWQYRYALRLPLRSDEKPLYVNWCEVTITDEAKHQVLYRNAWATDHPLEAARLHPFVVAARTRWKSENENNNVLKNYGYHLEHNFGHGQQYLALVLVMLNLFAFLFHTVLDLCDATYRQVRAELGARQTFFNDVQALTRYHFFADWQMLIEFMATGLELDTS